MVQGEQIYRLPFGRQTVLSYCLCDKIKQKNEKNTQLASMKGSMCNMRACVRLMMNWLTQAMAWDLQRNRRSGVTQVAHFTHMLRAVNAAPCLVCLPAWSALPTGLRKTRRLWTGVCVHYEATRLREFAQRPLTLVPDYPNKWCNSNKSIWLKRNCWSKFKSNAKEGFKFKSAGSA